MQFLLLMKLVVIGLPCHKKDTYAGVLIFTLRGSPSLVNGVRLRTLSLRSSWVQIPPPALQNFLVLINEKFIIHWPIVGFHEEGRSCNIVR